MAFINTGESFSHETHTSIYREDGTCTRVHACESVYIEDEIPVDENDVAQVLFSVTKSCEDKCLVSGWANVATNADGSLPLDWQDDIIPPEVLEKAAIGFMLNYRESGEMHEGESQGVVVESIVFTKEKQAAIGIPEGAVPEGWFITVKTSPELFAKVKDGTYKMFSIQGKSKKVKL